MRVSISEEEWRVVLGRARDVGSAMGAEAVAVLTARATLEAIGISVPVIPDELDAGPRVHATGRSGGRPPHPPEPAPGGPGAAETPRKDLRRSARNPAGADGYCPHCDVVYGAASIATLPDGNRLCPVHGTVVRAISEISEGRFDLARGADQPRARTATAALCGAPVGGHPCGHPVGHEGRHGVPRGVSG